MLSHPVLRLVRVVGLGALTFGIILFAVQHFVTPHIVTLGIPRARTPVESPPVDTRQVLVPPTSSPVPAGTQDPSARDPRLTQGTWHWQRTERGDGTTVVSSNPGAFTISFGTDGRFSLKTDCNSASGRYTVSGPQLTFEEAPMTLMACPRVPQPPQEWVFYRAVTDTAAYAFEGEHLILYLRQDGGHVVLTSGPA